MSLKDKLVDLEKDLIGKKIVAINFNDPYPLGYIIVEGGELICFEEDSEISIASPTTIERRIIYNKNLRELFLENDCITKEEYDKYELILTEQKKTELNHQIKREYELYLQLSDKFRHKKDLKRDNIFNGENYPGDNYISILDKAISEGFYYLSFNEKVYSVKDREMNNFICLLSDLK